MGVVNHEVSSTVCSGLQDSSHVGMPEVSLMLLKRQVSTVYFILTEVHTELVRDLLASGQTKLPYTGTNTSRSSPCRSHQTAD